MNPTYRSESKLSAHCSVNVDMSELSEWPAENIAALFNGVALVRAAANRKSEAQEKGEQR